MLLPVLPTLTLKLQIYVVEIAVMLLLGNTAYNFGYSISFEIACNREEKSIWKLDTISVLYITTPKKMCSENPKTAKTIILAILFIFWPFFTCQSLVVMVVMVDRPTIHCLIPSPSAVVWVWTAEELNISPQVEMICFKIESSPEKQNAWKFNFTATCNIHIWWIANMTLISRTLLRLAF